MAIRNVIKISVTPAAKSVVAQMAESHGMTEQAVASRAYEWFTAQDDVLRKGILGLLPDGYEVDVARLALERMAKAGDGRKSKPKK